MDQRKEGESVDEGAAGDVEEGHGVVESEECKIGREEKGGGPQKSSKQSGILLQIGREAKEPEVDSDATRFAKLRPKLASIDSGESEDPN